MKLLAPKKVGKVAAGKIKTEKLAAREQAFEIPKKIDSKLLDIFMYAPKCY